MKSFDGVKYADTFWIVDRIFGGMVQISNATKTKIVGVDSLDEIFDGKEVEELFLRRSKMIEGTEKKMEVVSGYPKLMISHEQDMIVLMLSEKDGFGTGVCLDSGFTFNDVGEYDTEWHMIDFVDYDEVFCLRNKQ